MKHLFPLSHPVVKGGLMGILALAVVTFGLVSPLGATPAKAAFPSDVQYSTVLDYSSTDLLLEQQGFAATSTYDCVIGTQSCTYIPSSTQTLAPSALSGFSYLANPTYTEALVTSYNAGQTPSEKVESIQNNTLTLKATLPALNGLVTQIYWSTDGNVLLLAESDGSLQKFNIQTNTLTTLKTTIPGGAAWVTISPNGRYIAYYIPAVISTGKRTFGIIDTNLDQGYTMNETISYWDLLSEGVRIFAFSPDSTHLLYLDDRSGHQTLYNVTLANLGTSGLTGSQITTKPYTIEDMQWASNSKIVFSANRDNDMQYSLYELNLNSYVLTKITDWVAYNQPMQTFGNYIQFQTADANGRVTKLFNIATKAVSTIQIPGVNDSLVGTTNEVVHQDGLYGVYLPTTTATSTLLVWLHGGPDRQTAIEYNSYMSYGGYDWVLNQVKAAGVPVLKINYPGSVDQGITFAESIKDNVGVVDASSTMQMINDFAAAHGYKHIYLMGNSYGGYLALKLLVSYPNQIAGVESLSGVTDWQTLLTNVPSSIFSVDFNGPPSAANQALYDKASIINNVSNIGNQKIVVIQGNADTEVPYEQSQLIDTDLVAAGKNVSYYTLNGEDHIYEQPSSYTLVCNQTMELLGLPDSSSCTMH